MDLQERVKLLGGSNIKPATAPDGTEFVSCTIKGQLTAVFNSESSYNMYSLSDGLYPEVYIWVDDNGEITTRDVLDQIKKLKGVKGALYFSCVVYLGLVNSGAKHEDIKDKIVRNLMLTNGWVNRTRSSAAVSKMYRGIKRHGSSVDKMSALELFNISYTSGDYIKTGKANVRIKKQKPIKPEVVRQTTSDSLLVNIASGDTPFFVCSHNMIKKYEGAEGVIVNKDGIYISHGDGESSFDSVAFTVEEAIKMAGM